MQIGGFRRVRLSFFGQFHPSNSENLSNEQTKPGAIKRRTATAPSSTTHDAADAQDRQHGVGKPRDAEADDHAHRDADQHHLAPRERDHRRSTAAGSARCRRRRVEASAANLTHRHHVAVGDNADGNCVCVCVC